MLKILRVVGFLILLQMIVVQGNCQANTSVLASGDWYKLQINDPGVYKISFAKLQQWGIDPLSINPNKIQIYGNGGGMLPQPISTPRPHDLIENYIYVHGAGDGRFDEGDYILFYAEGSFRYDYKDGSLQYEHNIYSDHNFYYLTVGTSDGLRVTTQANAGTTHPAINTYDHFEYYKEEKNNMLASGREWYSGFIKSTPAVYTFALGEVASNTEIKVHSAVMAQAFTPSTFKLYINDKFLGEQALLSIPDFNVSANTYSIKGRKDLTTFTINSSQVASADLSIKLEYQNTSASYAFGYLDYLMLEVVRPLKISDHQVIFRSMSSLDQTVSTFNVSGADASTMIWDIADALHPANQEYSLSNSIAAFGANTEDLREFVAFKPALLPEPAGSKISNQNIKGLSTPELLIITHEDFLTEAQRLAAFRSTHDGLTAQVVTPTQIYNEFSSGKQDITAIRDYVKFLYNKSNALKYLLLFGRGSYDYKNITENNTNYVPVYESYNSLHPLETYASDDFYGFLEDDEGAWSEQAGGNHTLEIGIGRLPVTTLQEASHVVDKLIDYSTNKEALGAWRNKVIFVADDGDANTHTSQSDQLTALIDTSYADFNYHKLFLDAYPQDDNPGQQRSPKAIDALNRQIEDGALVVNFTGHGGENAWTQEQILSIATIQEWKNANRLPLFVTATCEFGRHDDPRQRSGGELIVTTPDNGGISIISTCRPVFSSSNFALNRAFYKEIFSKTNGEYPRLGDIIKFTKNESIDKAIDLNRVGNRNFSLLGDPSLRLSYPKQAIVINSILQNGQSTDTLSALGSVVLEGAVLNTQGQIDETFNGTLEVTIFDKEVEQITLGDENNPYKYKARQNALFRGKASVTHGQFAVDFIVPKNISYKVGHGKVSLYAIHHDKITDANGSEINIKVGGTSASPLSDTNAPNIEVYFGDSTYRSGSPVANNSLLLVRLSDDSGINISGYGVGNNIVGSLDNQEIFILNDYYYADKNNSKRGWVMYPLSDLESGWHTLTINAWDVFNNPAEKTIEFYVAEEGTLSLTQLRGQPNPFYDHTTIAFDHNRAGEDLDVTLKIFRPSGQIIIEKSYSIYNANAHVELFDWNGNSGNGEKVPKGVYFIFVEIRSMADGAKNQRYEKLILIN